jgi:hypothetical protein
MVKTFGELERKISKISSTLKRTSDDISRVVLKQFGKVLMNVESMNLGF